MAFMCLEVNLYLSNCQHLIKICTHQYLYRTNLLQQVRQESTR